MKRAHLTGAAVALVVGALGLAVFPASAEAAPSNCPREHLCLYDRQHYQGRILKLYQCGSYSLERFNHSAGQDWRDKAESIYNNQTGGALSILYNTHFGRRVWVGELLPGQGFPTMTSRGHRKIDYVKVC